jgi:SRSO17 transposase
LKRLDRELTTFVEALTAGFGRPERRTAMTLYITGLLLDGERKSIEPIAARLVDRPDQIQAMRQRLQQCVMVSPSEADALFDRIAGLLERELPEVTAFVIEDTGFPKKGRHSVGVARQYADGRVWRQTSS